MHVTAFAASHRPSSINDALVREAVSCLHVIQPDWQVNHLPYSTFDTPLFNDALREANGFPDSVDAVHDIAKHTQSWVISVPEYNWSIPGSLKNMIDWLSSYRPTPFGGQHALLMCATPSTRGGVMGISHTKTIFEALGVHVFNTAFMLGNAHEHITAEGLQTDKKRNDLHDVLTRFSSHVNHARGAA